MEAAGLILARAFCLLVGIRGCGSAWSQCGSISSSQLQPIQQDQQSQQSQQHHQQNQHQDSTSSPSLTHDGHIIVLSLARFSTNTDSSTDRGRVTDSQLPGLLSRLGLLLTHPSPVTHSSPPRADSCTLAIADSSLPLLLTHYNPVADLLLPVDAFIDT